MDGKTFYITKAKLDELKKEYEELIDFERQRIASEEAPKIFESEDINPEFISFREDIGFLRARIDELKNILEHYQLIKPPYSSEQKTIGIGANVKIEANGKKEEFQIVGTLEANPELGKISNESPVGKALLGHKAGDEIVINSPQKISYKIKNVRYE